MQSQHKNFSLKKAFAYGFGTFIEHIEAYAKILLLSFLAFLALLLIVFTIVELPLAMIYHIWVYPKPFTLHALSHAFNTLPYWPMVFSSAGISNFFTSFILRALLIKKTIDSSFHINMSTLQYLFSKRVWKFILARILYSIRCMIGIILLVLPGIYWYIKYYFKGYSIISSSQDVSLSADHVHAAETTSGIRLKLLLYEFIWSALLAYITIPNLIELKTNTKIVRYFIPSSVFGINLLMPIIIITSVYIYKILTKQDQQAK